MSLVLIRFQLVRILGKNKGEQQSSKSSFSNHFSHAGAGIPPTLTTPSLPEESQTTDDLLDKI